MLAINGSIQCSMSKYNLTLTNTTEKIIAGNADLFADNGAESKNGEFNKTTGRKFDAITYITIEPGQSLTISRTIPDSFLK
jgi:hypothetical protein